MNKVILMGRLTRDPEVRYSQGDNSTAITTELQKTFHRLCDAYGIDNISFISDMDMNFDLAPTLVETDKKETGCI